MGEIVAAYQVLHRAGNRVLDPSKPLPERVLEYTFKLPPGTLLQRKVRPKGPRRRPGDFRLVPVVDPCVLLHYCLHGIFEVNVGPDGIQGPGGKMGIRVRLNGKTVEERFFPAGDSERLVEVVVPTLPLRPPGEENTFRLTPLSKDRKSLALIKNVVLIVKRELP